MSRRFRYADRASAGRSQIAPFLPGEGHRDRHARRLSVNLDAEASMRAWADEHGLALYITNNGHHWRFECGTFMAEWWPSSAKLVFGRQYKRGIHVHDWTQVQREIVKCLQRGQSR